MKTNNRHQLANSCALRHPERNGKKRSKMIDPSRCMYVGCPQMKETALHQKTAPGPTCDGFGRVLAAVLEESRLMTGASVGRRHPPEMKHPSAGQTLIWTVYGNESRTVALERVQHMIVASLVSESVSHLSHQLLCLISH